MIRCPLNDGLVQSWCPQSYDRTQQISHSSGRHAAAMRPIDRLLWPRAVMPHDWKGNRRSGVAVLTISHRLQ